MLKLTKVSNFIQKVRYISQNSTQNLILDTTNLSEGIAVIGFNRAKQKNAMCESLLENLTSLINDLKNDSKIRAVIFKSLVPGVFCVGADLKERLTMNEKEVVSFVSRFRELNNTIENLPMPTIAALDGIALGGGLEIALACDIRIAASTVKMGLVETKLAILPGAGGTQRLPRLINPSIAKELIYSARIVDGNEAKDYGIVNHSIKQNDNKDAAYQKALELARDIAANGPIGVRMAKCAINLGLQTDFANGIKSEGSCYAQLLSTKDRIEGLKAFQEKRTPKYSGQ